MEKEMEKGEEVDQEGDQDRHEDGGGHRAGRGVEHEIDR